MANHTSMRAGWASEAITPELGTPLGGRGVPPVLAATVRDVQLAQATVLEDAAGRRAVLASLDVPGIVKDWADPLREMIAARVGCPLPAVLLNASHTHSGGDTLWPYYATPEPMPPALVRFLEHLSAALLRAVTRAVENLQPATAHWASGTTHIGINRRHPDADGVIRHAPNPTGPVDREVWTLHLENKTGRAVLFAAACHTVMLYEAEPLAASADFIAPARDALQQALGAETHTQFFQGFAGDVRPAALAEGAAALAEGAAFRRAHPGETEAVGAQLARDVLAAMGNAPVQLNLHLAAVAGNWQVQASPAPDPEIFFHPTLKPDGTPQVQDVAVLHHLRDYWLHRVQHGPPPATSIAWPTGILQLDATHWICYLAGEPVAAWRALIDRICTAGGARSVAAWGYTQDYAAYLVTDAMLPEGGYEVHESNWFQRYFPQPLAPGIDASFAAEFTALTQRLEASHTAPQSEPRESPLGAGAVHRQ